MADRDIADFIAGLEGLSIAGVTMLSAEPESAPADNDLPCGWVMLPTIIGGPPLTAMNSAIRPVSYRALLVVVLALARQRRQKAYYDALMTAAAAVKDALDAAQIGFRLNYEMALDKKIQAGSETFYGLAVVVTGVP